jgi:hypothetical protein
VVVGVIWLFSVVCVWGVHVEVFDVVHVSDTEDQDDHDQPLVHVVTVINEDQSDHEFQFCDGELF